MDPYISKDRDTGIFSVDWARLMHDEKVYRSIASERAITLSPLEENLKELIDIDILSFSWKGTFWLTDGCGTSLSPCAPGGIPLTFTRKSDAISYAGIEYASARFPVEVVEL